MVHQAHPEHQVPQVHLEPQDPMVHQAHLEPQVPQVHLEHQVQLVLLDL
jgi:hypothetical protein